MKQDWRETAIWCNATELHLKGCSNIVIIRPIPSDRKAQRCYAVCFTPLFLYWRPFKFPRCHSNKTIFWVTHTSLWLSLLFRCVSGSKWRTGRFNFCSFTLFLIRFYCITLSTYISICCCASPFNINMLLCLIITWHNATFVFQEDNDDLYLEPTAGKSRHSSQELNQTLMKDDFLSSHLPACSPVPRGQMRMPPSSVPPPVAAHVPMWVHFSMSYSR